MEKSEIQKLVELGSDEINRLLEEHTVGYVDALGGTIRKFDDTEFCRKLIEAKYICDICEETTKNTICRK